MIPIPLWPLHFLCLRHSFSAVLLFACALSIPSFLFPVCVCLKHTLLLFSPLFHSFLYLLRRKEEKAGLKPAKEKGVSKKETGKQKFLSRQQATERRSRQGLGIIHSFLNLYRFQKLNHPISAPYGGLSGGNSFCAASGGKYITVLGLIAVPF